MLHRAIDLRGDLPPNHCTHESHQALRLAKLPLTDGLHNDQEGIMHAVIQVLRT
jgi:hypothetical protein